MSYSQQPKMGRAPCFRVGTEWYLCLDASRSWQGRGRSRARSQPLEFHSPVLSQRFLPPPPLCPRHQLPSQGSQLSLELLQFPEVLSPAALGTGCHPVPSPAALGGYGNDGGVWVWPPPPVALPSRDWRSPRMLGGCSPSASIPLRYRGSSSHPCKPGLVLGSVGESSPRRSPEGTQGDRVSGVEGCS